MPDGTEALAKRYRSAKTILLVEGEKRLRQSVSVFLRTSGYHLIDAISGSDAIQKAHDFKGPIHLLLANLDVSGISGIELARRLERERGRK